MKQASKQDQWIMIMESACEKAVEEENLTLGEFMSELTERLKLVIDGE